MVWLLMSLISVVFTVVATTITPDNSPDWFRIAQVALSFVPGMNVDVPIPGLSTLIVGLLGVVVLAVGLGLVYLDSRVAVEEIRKRNSTYKVALQRISELLWRDVLHSRQQSFIGQLPIRFAQIVFAFYLVKSLAGITVWIAGILIDVLSRFVPFLAALPINAGSLFSLVTNLLGWGMDERGMLLCVYAGLVLVAAWFSRYERAFYDDYAVMQQQLKHRQN
jgi:hypothetical protein